MRVDMRLPDPQSREGYYGAYSSMAHDQLASHAAYLRRELDGLLTATSTERLGKLAGEIATMFYVFATPATVNMVAAKLKEAFR